MTALVQCVQGVQGSVQGFLIPLHTVVLLCHKGFVRLCRVCRATLTGARAPVSRTLTRTRGMLSRTYTPMHTLHTLHKIVVVRVSGVQGSKNHPAHPAHLEICMQKPGNLRTEMPTVAGWIDSLRAAFGAESINAAIRAGLDGQPTFYAEENGREIGVKSSGQWVSMSDTVIGDLGASVKAEGARK